MTTTSYEPPNKLDQIEAILMQVAAQQQANTEAIKANTQSIANLTVKLDGVTEKLDQVAAQQKINTEEIASVVSILMTSIGIVETDRDTYHAEFNSLIETANADREAWQAESRRIWEYLRNRNGGSSTPV